MGFGKAPDGSLVNVAKDVTKVVELDTTLQELLMHAQDKQVDALTLIFESEDPDVRKRPNISPLGHK